MNNYITWADLIQLSIAVAAWVGVMISLHNNKKK